MDLKQFEGLTEAQEEGIDVRLVHPGTGDELDAVIKVAGPDSERMQSAKRRMANARLRKQKMKQLTYDELDQEAVKALAQCVISWENIEVNGKALECTPENAFRLFQEYPFIREQVDAVVGDRAAFLAS